jgi:hypothetical protein
MNPTLDRVDSSVRRFAMKTFLRIAGAAGIPVLAMSALVASPAGAGGSVDPSTLEPPPPPGAECRQDGRNIICQTGLVIDLVNEPVFDLPCGTLYETSHDVRVGIRWYDEDGKLVKRNVRQDVDGRWSLASNGAAPTVSLSAHDNWGEVYPTPGDLSSAVGHVEGDGFAVSAPGYGVIAHIAGREDSEGFHGSFTAPDDPAVAEELCAALSG